MKALIDGEIANLQALIDDDIFTRDDEERAATKLGLAVYESKEGTRLRRYAKEAESLLKWTTHQFKAGRHIYEGMVQDRSKPAFNVFAAARSLGI